MANKKINLSEGLKNITLSEEQSASAVTTHVSMDMKLDEAKAEKYIRTTIAIKESNLDKMKIVAVKSKAQMKDLFNQALEDFLADWEKKIGLIKL